MERTKEEIQEANLALQLMYPNLSIDLQYRFMGAIKTIQCAIDEIHEIEKENELEKQKIIDAFDCGFTDGCRYTTGYEQTQWQEGEIYYEEIYKNTKQ